MSQRIELTLPLPDKVLHPNGRTRSFQKRARLVKKARSDAALVGRSVFSGEPFESADVHATFYMPRRMDGDNLNAWLKSYLDGLQDAGIVQNDSALRLLAPAQITGKSAKGERKVVLTVDRRPASA